MHSLKWLRQARGPQQTTKPRQSCCRMLMRFYRVPLPSVHSLFHPLSLCFSNYSFITEMKLNIRCCIFCVFASSLCAYFVENLESLYFLKHNTNLCWPEYVFCIWNIYVFLFVDVCICSRYRFAFMHIITVSILSWCSAWNEFTVDAKYKIIVREVSHW